MSLRLAKLWILFPGLLLGWLVAETASAHELRPAFLSIEESAKAKYDVLWKTPKNSAKPLKLRVNFPVNCVVSERAWQVEAGDFAIETWRLGCETSLLGQSVSIEGLEKTLTDVLVRASWLDGPTMTARLTPDRTRLDFAGEQARGGPVHTYFALGMEHILGGIDHLLFVLAVMLLITRGKTLLMAITAFTIGHSVTLALASLGLVQVQSSLVEILIALSIVLMAYEAARHLQGRSGLTLQFPWVVTFCFGLLHGFGFAGALTEIGLPQTDLPLALLLFNIGVEAGQLLFIVGILLLVSVPLLKQVLQARPAMLIASYCIGIMAVFWTMQRVALLI